MNPNILKALLISGLIVAGSLGLKYLNAHGVIASDAHEISIRAWNITCALILMWWANSGPKRLRPLTQMSGDPGTEQSTRRFLSTAIVVAAFLSALDWLIAPFNLALPLEAAAIGGALIIAFARSLFAQGQR